MSCREIRDQLMQNEQDLPEGVTAHLSSCPDCAGFAEKMHLARAAFRAHRSDHVPGPGFAYGVRAALPGRADLLGWAALRLLPATLALTLVLSAWCWVATPGPQALLEQSPTDDLLGWVLEDGS